MSGLSAQPLQPLIGSELRAAVPDLLSGVLANELRALLIDRGVLLFRDLEITQDEHKVLADMVQVLTEPHIKMVDDSLAQKEKEIMQV